MGGRPIKRKAKEVEEIEVEDEGEDSDEAENQGAPDYGYFPVLLSVYLLFASYTLIVAYFALNTVTSAFYFV